MRTNLFIFILLLPLFFISCEKVVDLDLKKSESKLVINAQITSDSPCVVMLSESLGFYDTIPYKRVSGAQIKLSDNKGNTEIIRESKDPGIYISSMTGYTGRTYTLNVTIGNDEYSSVAKIPKAVPIDSLYIYNIKIGKDDWYSPCITYLDPIDEENYYYTIVYVNGAQMKTIYINNDENRNGLNVERILYFDKEDNNDNDLKIGDHISVDMQSLDKATYIFYKSLSSVAAGGATNPITNITNGALGCFKAYASSSKEIIINQNHIYTQIK